MSLKNNPQAFLVAGILFLSGGAPVIAATPDTAAWIESVKPKDALTSTNAQTPPKIVILRQGKPLTFNSPVLMAELKSGDRILFNGENNQAYLNLINSNGALRITAADAKKEGYEVNAKPNSTWNNLVAFVTDKIKPGQTQAVSASTRGSGTRGSCPKPEEIDFPSILADQTETPKMAAGERALHFMWECGQAPYRLSLVQNDKILNAVDMPSGFEATLPKQNLKPGTYKLVLSDTKGQSQPPFGNAYVTENLILVAPADVPPMPEALAKAPLPEETRQLLYADWLAKQGNGEWSMEAIQLVIPFAKTYEPAADWLRQWGGQ